LPKLKPHGTAEVPEAKQSVPSAISIRDLQITPEQITQNSSVSITATIANDGRATAQPRIGLKINGESKAFQEVTLAPEETQQVVFTTTADAPGEYQVAIEALADKSSVIPSAEEGQTSPSPADTGLGSEYSVTVLSPSQQTEAIQMHKQVEPEAPPVQPLAQESPARKGAAFEIWQDARTAKLIATLVSNGATEFSPVIDFSLKDSFAYPEADKILGASGTKTRQTLETLAEYGILNKKPLEKLYADPEGSLQLVPVERCPHCGSVDISSGRLIEHFACGNVQIEQDYREDHTYFCPKCHRELRLIGTDYRYVGMQHKCLNCNEVFPTPVIKWRSVETGKVWAVEELGEVWLYSYSLRPDKIEWLEFQLKPKAQLVEFLRLRGYQVEELADVRGNSGAAYTLDMLATKDDELTTVRLGIGILTAMPGEKEISLEGLFEFDTMAYDVGMNYKVVIAIPKLGSEAMKFAERQKTEVFELSDMEKLTSLLNSQSSLSSSTPIVTEGHPVGQIDPATPQPRAQVMTFLQRCGYEVFEKAKVIGKSGADHIFDIFARRDDGIIMPTVAVDIATAEEGQVVDVDEVSQFDAKAFDSGIRHKVFVAMPEMSPRAKQFAEQQRIRVFEAKDLHKLASPLH